MKHILLTFFSITLLSGSSFGQDSSAFKIWTYKTASCLPQKEWEYSLQGPLRYGLCNGLELQTNPILNLILPNITARIALGKVHGFTFASEHEVAYYSPFLRFFQGDGTGALIAPTANVPTALVIRNGIVTSRNWQKLAFTSGLDINLSLHSTKMEQRYSVDIPLLYPRLAPIYSGVTLKWSNTLQGKISKNWSYLSTSDFFVVPTGKYNLFIEAGENIAWTPGTRFTAMAGVKFVYGNYPFGSQAHLIPTFNVVYRSKRTSETSKRNSN